MKVQNSHIINHHEDDDFWNIDFTPTNNIKKISDNGKSTETVEITVSSALESMSDSNTVKSEKLSGNQGTIKKYINSNYIEEKKKERNPDIEYTLNKSLVHKVKIYNWHTTYNFYEDFYQDALKYLNVEVTSAKYSSFFSYVPQYNQLNPKQLNYYFYFRTNARKSIFVEADYSFVLLYIYEIINLGNAMDTQKGLSQLCWIWNNYKKIYPKLNKMLIEWICDYCFINKLLPPTEIDTKELPEICSLKEFFAIPRGNDYLSYTHILLEFSTAYNYKSSKFAVGENLKYYDKYIPLALCECVKMLSTDGVFSKVDFNDCVLPRDAFAGALCCHRIKKKIVVEYCSFSKTNDLRYLIGDIVKYSENKIRSYLGIKSRLSCYTLDLKIKDILDNFFTENLKRHTPVKKKEKAHDYDVLYDLPKKKLSISNASKIEEDSWETTMNLVDAFEGNEENPMDKPKDNDFIDSSEKNLYEAKQDLTFTDLSFDTQQTFSTNDNDFNFLDNLGKYKEFAVSVFKDDIIKQRKISSEFGCMIETVADKINELSMDLIGDVLIEDSDGKLRVINDYKNYFTDLED